MTWVRVQMRINCTECGMTVPVNGPLRTIHCDNCQADVQFEDDDWEDVFESLLEDTHAKNGKVNACSIFDQFDTKLLSAKIKPCCPKCKGNLPAAELETGKPVVCPGCRETLMAIPAPDWLRRLAPAAVMLFNAVVREGQPGPEAETAKPVLFSCLQCGAPLKVDGTSRILTCDACDTDCYLPDPLWLRLHPAQVMQRWHVGFGKAAEEKKSAEAPAK